MAPTNGRGSSDVGHWRGLRGMFLRWYNTEGQDAFICHSPRPRSAPAMLDHLPQFYPNILDPTRPRFESYPYTHEHEQPKQQHQHEHEHPHPESRPQSLSPLTDPEPEAEHDAPFAYDAGRSQLHRPSSHSPTLSPPPLSASSSGTLAYEHPRPSYADFERSPDRLAQAAPFTVSPLPSHAHSLDRRLSEPAIRSLYTTQPHQSVQLAPLHAAASQNAAYCSPRPASSQLWSWWSLLTVLLASNRILASTRPLRLQPLLLRSLASLLRLPQVPSSHRLPRLQRPRPPDHPTRLL